jgi:4-amino-4-deoxy-L-arabinose transferase-like glycosyltransferase
MSKLFNQDTYKITRLTLKKLLFFLLISLIISFICYELLLKDFLIEKIKSNDDFLDREYYSAIFLNLESAIYLTFFFISILYFFYGRLTSFLSRLNDKNILRTVLVCNALLQLLILIFVKTIPISDSFYYIQLSEQLFSTGSYMNAAGNLTGFLPVGLPAYLAVLKFISSNHLLLAKILNIVYISLFILLLFNLFKNELSQKGKLIFLFAFVLFPNNLFSSNIIMTDYPFTFLLWLVVYILIKSDNSIVYLLLIGIILGLISFLRPIGLLLPLIFIFYFYKSYGLKTSVIKSAYIVIVMILIVSPWLYRNYIVFNEIVPISTNGGFNFLMGNHKYSSGGLNFNFEYNSFNPDEAEESRKAYYTAFQHIFENPFSSILRLPKKIYYCFHRGDSSITWALKSTENNIPPIFLSFVFFATNFFFYMIVLLSIIGLMRWKVANDFRLKQLFFYIYLFTISMVIVYVGGERYLIPVLPIHFFLFTKAIVE